MLDNHHCHLQREVIDQLFGEGYVLPVKRDLGGGEYASSDCVDVVGPKGTLKSIRIIGPYRPFTQVELLASDAVKLGAKVPVVESGNLADAAELTLVGPKGSVTLPCGIIAARHVHICTKRLAELGLKDRQIVSVTSSGVRSITFHNVLVRENTVSEQNVIHMDFEEGNAAGLKNGDVLELEY